MLFKLQNTIRFTLDRMDITESSDPNVEDALILVSVYTTVLLLLLLLLLDLFGMGAWLKIRKPR